MGCKCTISRPVGEKLNSPIILSDNLPDKEGWMRPITACTSTRRFAPNKQALKANVITVSQLASGRMPHRAAETERWGNFIRTA
jgi:hypothetical protein